MKFHLHKSPLFTAFKALLLLAVLGATFLYATTRYQAHLVAVAKQTASLPHYGVAAGGNLPDLSPADLSTEMTGLESLGTGWVRFDFDWSRVQPDNASSYSWDAYDRIVASAKAHHLQIIGIIDFTPAWARASDCSVKQCEPQNPAQYAAFARALTARYKPQSLHTWEIWNEPNTTQFWQPAPSTTKYSALLKAAYQQIHAEDHNAIVISGSTAPATTAAGEISPADFLAALYNTGAKTSFDAAGDHPYTFPVPPSYKSNHAWAQMSEGPGSLRAIMIAHGDMTKKIWITEFGIPTDGPGPSAELSNYHLDLKPWHVTEALQAYSISEAVRLYKSYNWVGPLLLYSYQDAGTTPDTNENFFGLVRADGSHKPAYDAFIQATAVK